VGAALGLAEGASVLTVGLTVVGLDDGDFEGFFVACDGLTVVG
jgi:hypothetical protein